MDNKKLGAGIITVSVLNIIGGVFGLLSFSMFFFMKDTLNEMYAQMGIPLELTTTDIAISLVFAVTVLAGTILILMKKKIGIYIYFLQVVLNIIYSIVMTGFNIASILISLILPVLMVYFIYKKKEIFGFETETDSVNL